MAAALAGRSKGLVRRRDLARAGLTRHDIERLVRRGVLLRVYRGVYRVGHRAPSVEATYLAAVWACGEGSLLSVRAAAHNFELTKGGPPAPHVTTPTERRVRGIITRRSPKMCRHEATTWKGIPTTTVAATLVDLAAVLTSPGDLARACHEAQVRHGTTPAHVEAVLQRRRNAPGAKRLRAVLDGDDPTLLSHLERAFRTLLTEHGLPLPATNRKQGAHHVDCRWPEHRLTVELDSYRYHHTRHAFEGDRRREREARARGDDFRRLTYGDVLERPGPTVAELAAKLTPGARTAP